MYWPFVTSAVISFHAQEYCLKDKHLIEECDWGNITCITYIQTKRREGKIEKLLRRANVNVV